MPFHETDLQDRHKRRLKRQRQVPDIDNTDDDDETVNNPVDADQNMPEPQGRSGNQNAVQGYRGAYIGDLPNQPRFAKRYQEQMLLHSRATRFLCFTWWNFLNVGLNDSNSSFMELQTQPPGNFPKPYGLSASPDTFWAGASQIVNPSMAMRVNPINFSVRDVIDTKLLNRWANGERSVYSKFRLLGFRVTIEFSTYNGTHGSINRNLIELAPAVPATQTQVAGYGDVVGGTANMNTFNTPVSQRIPMKYFVYRDAYLDYSGQNGYINYVGTDLNVGNTQFGMLSQDLANLNNFLEVVNDGEPFHFERKINAKAAYFIPPAFFQDSNNLNKPLHVLVAALESLDQQGAIVTPLPEGFHFIFAPINPPFGFESIQIPNSVPQPSRETKLIGRCYTQAYIKVEADWEAWDFNYNLNDPARTTKEGIEIAEKFNQISDQLLSIRKFTTYSKPLCMQNLSHDDPITQLSTKCDNEIRERSSDLDMTHDNNV